MRLLHTRTLELHEFVGDTIPPYVILSHRWEEDEVTFQNLRDGRGPKLAGWPKIVESCKQAAKDTFDYTWIDSCCIDKSSSAELSEAINSMFQWYQDAQMCYAFLSDVPAEKEDPREQRSAFRRSKWFTRGWTLQELLAPGMVIFFNKEWHEIGTKASLKDVLESITGIKEEHLFDAHQASIAQKISWAAERQTTRIEDKAYCLLGLIGVNMPPLYGEGKKSFLRLQLEILRESDDESIFVWVDRHGRNSGFLAESPFDFADCGDVASLLPSERFTNPYFMTNKGLQIAVPVPTMRTIAFDPGAIVLPLSCHIKGKRLALHMRSDLSLHLRNDNRDDFYRSSGQTLHSMIKQYKEILPALSKGSSTKVVYVRQLGRPPPLLVREKILINMESLLQTNFSIVQRYSYNSRRGWEEEDLKESSLSTKGREVVSFIQKGAVVLVFQDGSAKFGLEIAMDGKVIGLNIVVAPIGLSPNENARFWQRSTLATNRMDRAFEGLRSAGFVSAALKKRVASGQAQFEVEIEVVEDKGLQID